MTLIDEVIKARGGWTDCGLSKQPCPSLTQLAEEFSLSTDLATYHEIDAAEAQRLVQFVLQYDLAYHSQLMPGATGC
jgi:hypothetical protein